MCFFFDINYVCIIYMALFANSMQDIETVAKAFANYYYRSIINGGWTHVMNVYDPTCRCSINNKNMYPAQMVSYLAVNNVYKAQVNQPMLSWKLVGDRLKITITSNMSFLDACDYHVRTCFVSDSFDISYSRKKVMDHVMHIRGDIHPTGLPHDW